MGSTILTGDLADPITAERSHPIRSSFSARITTSAPFLLLFLLLHVFSTEHFGDGSDSNGNDVDDDDDDCDNACFTSPMKLSIQGTMW